MTAQALGEEPYMARIESAYRVDDEELVGMTPQDRLDAQSSRILAHRPEMADALNGLIAALLGDSGTLPRRLTELVRLRIAFWNQCRSCMSVRYDPGAVSEELVCSLERPEEAEDLTDAEKAALRFADLMATNHLAIDETVYDDLRRHFTEGELVELGLHCAEYVGYGRMAATWALHEHLDGRYRAPREESYTPWGGGALR
jgi:alkylhydroperoxidase family enzyme